MSKLREAIDTIGPVEIARRMGIKYQTVQYWREAPPRPKYWPGIVQATDGKVTQADLIAESQAA